MSKLVLGTVQFGLNYGINNNSGKPSLEKVIEILRATSEFGITELDSAQAYGDSEEVIGKSLQYIDSDFLIHSKFSFEENNFDLSTYLYKSLKALNVEKLGYFFFHKFSDFLYFKDHFSLQEIEEVNKNSMGLAVSLYDEEEFKIVLSCDFVKAIQLPFNIFDSSVEKIELMKKAREKGIKVYARSVFLQGLFFKETEKLPNQLRPFKDYLNKLNSISAEFDISKMVLALAFARECTGIDGVLIGVDNLEQLKSNIDAWGTPLSEEVMEQLMRLKFPDKELLLPKNWN